MAQTGVYQMRKVAVFGNAGGAQLSLALPVSWGHLSVYALDLNGRRSYDDGLWNSLRRQAPFLRQNLRCGRAGLVVVLPS